MKLNISKVLYSFVVMVLYLVSGTLLLLKYFFWQEVPNKSLASFGLVVMLYGLYRGYRAYRDYKTYKEEQNAGD